MSVREREGEREGLSAKRRRKRVIVIFMLILNRSCGYVLVVTWWF